MHEQQIHEMTLQGLFDHGQVIVVARLHQYMAFIARVLMYSRGQARGNTLTRGLQVPCTDVTMLQVTCILVVLTFGSLLNCSWQSCYHARPSKQLLRRTYVRGRTRTVTASWSSSASYWRLILFELVSCSSHKRRFACVLPSE